MYHCENDQPQDSAYGILLNNETIFPGDIVSKSQLLCI